LEHGQPERGFGNQKITGYRFKRRAGRIVATLVVACNDGTLAIVIDHDLRAAEDMPGRPEGDVDIADPECLAVSERLPIAPRVVTEPACHDRQRFWRGEHRVMPGPRVIRMSVRDDRTLCAGS